jgi:ABC-type multidrug transport system fused ATPase/permease subunit
MDNLRYRDPDASNEQVIHATQVDGIHNFIVSLPEGYQAIEGERGVNLSEGQKQLLS